MRIVSREPERLVDASFKHFGHSVLKSVSFLVDLVRREAQVVDKKSFE